ncbi:MAG TPA: YtxH domain-containing protein [Candidatus Limnocylindria bacterium]|nr:YtxH domain-containing protein [Candidatus Limnocylindria bacterium]
MISTKDLRDFFDEATKRAGDAIGDARVPNIGRSDPTPGFLYFGLGLVFGALVGVVVAFLATPYNGEQARQKLSAQVEKVRKSREESGTNGSTYASPATGADYLTSASHERS